MQGATHGVQQPAPKGWHLYFAGSEYQAQDRRACLVRDLVAALKSDAGWEQLSNVRQLHDVEYAVQLDYEALQGLCRSADLAAALELQPLEGLACLDAAAYEAVFFEHPQALQEARSHPCPPGRLTVRLLNYGPSQLHIRQLKAPCIGRLATIRGTIIRMGCVKPLVTCMSFVCGKCGAQVQCAFPDGKYTPPTRCSGEGCRSKTFAPVKATAQCVDWQKVRVQELIGADQQQQGQVPRTVEVELRGDLVNCAVVGDVVSVLGLVKVMATSEDHGKAAKGNKNLFLIYLDAVSLATSRKASKQPASLTQGGSQELQQQQMLPPNAPAFTMKDLAFVVRFTEQLDGQQLKHLVHALCPAIYGHELVKAGMLLALLGGVRKNVGHANRVPIRGDIHVLVVGDPGLGKSQLLQAAAAAAPRGLYVCGNTSTTAGLTVSVVKDAVTGDFMFEAGAVVLADRGTCCVDEFDKMPAEHQALLEAMEQQEVSVAKAGILASLPARTSIIAAANPVEGHYNRAKTLQENLKMSPAMLSRFDLLFVLLDRPDEALDQCLSEHVMALHSGVTGRAQAAKLRLLEHRPTQQLALPAPAGFEAGPARLPLAQRLRMAQEDCATPPLPLPLLRKYIAYARAHVHPRLSDEARGVLQACYLRLRSQCGPMDSAPVTARQLESLVRLAEARARCELREEVSREDAEDAVEILQEALQDRFLGSSSIMVDPRRKQGHGSRGGQAGEAERFLATLRRLAQAEGRDTFAVSELYTAANDMHLKVPDLGKMIERLNDAGDLLKSGGSSYRVRGAGLTAPE